MKHICGLDNAALLFDLESEQPRSKLPQELKPQKTDKQQQQSRQDDKSLRQHDLRIQPSEIVNGIHSVRVSSSERKIAEGEAHGQEEILRGRDKSKRISVTSATRGDISEQFTHQYDRQKVLTRKEHEAEVFEKTQEKDDRQKRRQRSLQTDSTDISLL